MRDHLALHTDGLDRFDNIVEYVQAITRTRLGGTLLVPMDPRALEGKARAERREKARDDEQTGVRREDNKTRCRQPDRKTRQLHLGRHRQLPRCCSRPCCWRMSLKRHIWRG